MEECVICKIERNRNATCKEWFFTCKTKFPEKLHKLNCCGQMYHAPCLNTYLLNKKKQDSSLEEGEYRNKCPHCQQICDQSTINFDIQSPTPNQKMLKQSRFIQKLIIFIFIISAFVVIAQAIIGGILSGTISCPFNRNGEERNLLHCNQTIKKDYNLKHYGDMVGAGYYMAILVNIIVTIVFAMIIQNYLTDIQLNFLQIASQLKKLRGILLITLAVAISKIIYLVVLSSHYNEYKKMETYTNTQQYTIQEINDIIDDYKKLALLIFMVPDIFVGSFIIIFGIGLCGYYTTKKLIKCCKENRREILYNNPTYTKTTYKLTNQNLNQNDTEKVLEN